jgi:hypothetical protein
MSLIRSLSRIMNKNVRCATCMAVVPKHTTIMLFERNICDWCVNYYSKIFPNDWEQKIKLLIL